MVNFISFAHYDVVSNPHAREYSVGSGQVILHGLFVIDIVKDDRWEFEKLLKRHVYIDVRVKPPRDVQLLGNGGVVIEIEEYIVGE